MEKPQNEEPIIQISFVLEEQQAVDLFKREDVTWLCAESLFLDSCIPRVALSCQISLPTGPAVLATAVTGRSELSRMPFSVATNSNNVAKERTETTLGYVNTAWFSMNDTVLSSRHSMASTTFIRDIIADIEGAFDGKELTSQDAGDGYNIVIPPSTYFDSLRYVLPHSYRQDDYLFVWLTLDNVIRMAWLSELVKQVPRVRMEDNVLLASNMSTLSSNDDTINIGGYGFISDDAYKNSELITYNDKKDKHGILTMENANIKKVYECDIDSPYPQFYQAPSYREYILNKTFSHNIIFTNPVSIKLKPGDKIQTLYSNGATKADYIIMKITYYWETGAMMNQIYAAQIRANVYQPPT